MLYKLVIAGCRDFNNYDLLKEEVNSVLGNPEYRLIEVVSGAASGADRLGEQFAKDHGCCVRQFPADWKAGGAAAGPMRNEQMAHYADEVIVFWDRKSRGTASMISRTRKHKKPLSIVYVKPVTFTQTHYRNYGQPDSYSEKIYVKEEATELEITKKLESWAAGKQGDFSWSY